MFHSHITPTPLWFQTLSTEVYCISLDFVLMFVKKYKSDLGNKEVMSSCYRENFHKRLLYFEEQKSQNNFDIRWTREKLWQTFKVLLFYPTIIKSIPGIAAMPVFWSCLPWMAENSLENLITVSSESCETLPSILKIWWQVLEELCYLQNKLPKYYNSINTNKEPAQCHDTVSTVTGNKSYLGTLILILIP